MFQVLLLILPLFFSFPELEIKKYPATPNQSQGTLELNVLGEDPLLESCVRGGLEMRYKISLELCRKRTFWLDRCAGEKHLVHLLSYDPISQHYKFVTDWYGDPDDPIATSVEDLVEARKRIASISDLEISKLWDGEPLAELSRMYLHVRVVSDCKGEYNQTLARISNFLTLGLIRINGSDTGRKTFTF